MTLRYVKTDLLWPWKGKDKKVFGGVTSCYHLVSRGLSSRKCLKAADISETFIYFICVSSDTHNK